MDVGVDTGLAKMYRPQIRLEKDCFTVATSPGDVGLSPLVHCKLGVEKVSVIGIQFDSGTSLFLVTQTT
jgi:hypothetical protein